MRSEVLGLPDQLRAASTAPVPSVPTSPVAVFAGMGGSGMAARIGALVAAAAGVPSWVHRGYGLPPWAESARPLVIAVSYSGTTQETVSSVTAALDLGLPLAVVTSGGDVAGLAAEHDVPLLRVPAGLQPRAALGHQTGAVVRLLEGAEVIGGSSDLLLDAAAATEERLAADGPTAAVIAGDLKGLIPVVYGSAGAAATAALRWQTQVNENAKLPAFAGEIPEMNHNQLEGWRVGAATERGCGFVLLSTPSDSPQMAKRHHLTAELLAASGRLAGRVEASGSTLLAQAFTLMAVGDLVSLELATAGGVAATPVDTLESFKRRLSEA